MAAIVRVLWLVNLRSVIPWLTPTGITDFFRQNFYSLSPKETSLKKQEIEQNTYLFLTYAF